MQVHCASAAAGDGSHRSVVSGIASRDHKYSTIGHPQIAKKGAIKRSIPAGFETRRTKPFLRHCARRGRLPEPAALPEADRTLRRSTIPAPCTRWQPFGCPQNRTVCDRSEPYSMGFAVRCSSGRGAVVQPIERDGRVDAVPGRID
jgi:hypothetical protein